MIAGVKIEKDPEVQKLTQNVFQQLAEIVAPHETAVENQQDIQFVSFEQALKELAALKNS